MALSVPHTFVFHVILGNCMVYLIIKALKEDGWVLK